MKAEDIKELLPEHAQIISDMIINDRSEYRQHFTPFAFDVSSISEMLTNSVADRYWGIWIGKQLCGLFMLRGFDKGFERPAFGVYIRERFANRGLGQIALRHVLSWCQVNLIRAVMLKVHPLNDHAIRIYHKAGFKLIGECPDTLQYIMEKRLT